MEPAAESPEHKLDISFERCFKRHPLPMWIYDPVTLHVLTVNDAALAHYGYSEQEFASLSMSDLCGNEDAGQMAQYLKRPLDEGSIKRVWWHRKRNGQLTEVETVTGECSLNGIAARMVLVRDLSEQRLTEQAQRDISLRLTGMLESISEGFITLDTHWCFSYINSVAEAHLGCQRSELLGRNIWEKYPEAAHSIIRNQYERAVKENKTVRFETFYEPMNVWWSIAAFPSVQGLAIFFRDVTDMHDAEQRVHEEGEILAAVVNSTTDGLISVDPEGRIIMFNPGAERIFRRSSQSMQGQFLEDILPERFRAAHRLHRQRFSESGVASRMMGLGLVKGLRSDGQEIDLEGTISQVTVRQQKVLIANLRDVSERVRSVAEFQSSSEQLTELTKRLMMQEKTLVKRLALALHDQLGQTIAAIRISHETMVALQKDMVLPFGVDRLQAQLGTLINQAVRQVRQVLIDLRPPLLDDQGLAAALDNELRNRSMNFSNIDISIHVNPHIASTRWPAEVEYAAFMVAREAVENALQHASASSLAISLNGSEQNLQLEIVDNGTGIAPGAKPKAGHLGILGMQERAQFVGADVSITPAEAHGTKVAFSWHSTP